VYNSGVGSGSRRQASKIIVRASSRDAGLYLFLLAVLTYGRFGTGWPNICRRTTVTAVWFSGRVFPDSHRRMLSSVTPMPRPMADVDHPLAFSSRINCCASIIAIMMPQSVG
jgi:hypothetical protein